MSGNYSFLRKYVTLESEVIDAEYKIDYWDNSKGIIPGRSDWDITVAVKVPRVHLNRWLTGFVKADVKDVDPAWWNGLPICTKAWERNSKPEVYKRTDQKVYLMAFIDEGIILKKISSIR